ncbi:MAG TPA: discoidin domain-containing protein, partial [Clostridia bacterium]
MKKLLNRLISMLLIAVFTFTSVPSFVLPAFAAAGTLVYGDVDGNGKVNSSDYSYVKRYLLGTISSFPTDNGLRNADVNGDGKINSTDVSLIKRFLLGIISKFPADTAVPPTPEYINIALGKNVTASSQINGSSPSNAVDGNSSTQWSSNSPGWIDIDLGGEYYISGTSIEASGSIALSYTVQVSTDSSSYRTVLSNTASSSLFKDDYYKVRANHLKIIFSSPDNAASFSINEIRVFGADVLEVSRGKIATCSSSDAASSPQYAVDGASNTGWTAGLSSSSQWLKVDLGAEYTIDRTEIAVGSSKNYKYKIDVSSDDTSYSNIVDKTSNTSSSSLYNDSFTPSKARFVMLAITGADINTIDIREFRVFMKKLSLPPVDTSTPSPVIITDYLRPFVTLSVSAGKVNTNGSAQIKITATDDTALKSKTVKVNGSDIVLDSVGSSVYTFTTPGVYKIEGIAYDNSGNQGYDSKEIRCVTSSDGTAPTASIAGPSDGTFASMPIDITGSAIDANFSDYVLEYSEKGTGNYVKFAEGKSQVSNGILGTFDPSLVKSGMYDIRLTVYDKGGLSSQSIKTIIAQGKLGMRKFGFSANDITLPIQGNIPLDLTRYYDSRNGNTSGDFGYGWSSYIDGIHLLITNDFGDGWTSKSVTYTEVIAETRPHIITVAYPDGKLESFYMTFESTVLGMTGGAGELTASFKPVPGTTSTLQASITDCYAYDDYTNGFGLWSQFDYSGTRYSPGTFTLTTVDGTKIRFDAQGKVSGITGSDGSTLTRQADGITVTSSGVSKKLAFSKLQGRITSARDLKNQSVAYEYDSYGDLVSVTDQKNNKTKYIYDEKHRLQNVINNENVLISHSIYDSQGRLLEVDDAAGRKTRFVDSVENGKNVLTVYNRRNKPTKYVFKSDGNVESITDALNNTTNYTYNDSGLKVTESGPSGSYKFDYDNQIVNSITDTSKDAPSGYTFSSTYTNGRLSTLKSPGSTAVNNSYNNGKLTSTTDAKG